MKKKWFLLIFGIAALFLFSCETSVSPGISGKVGSYPSTPEYRIFKAQNAATNDYHDVPSELLYNGVKCTIWGEIALGISPSTAYKMANTYDTLIYPNMMNAFGFVKNFTEGGKVVTRNTMEYADYLGDGDGKLCILLLDIKDNYGVGGNTSYVAGYFSSINFLINSNSNRCDMVYVDAYPGVPGSDQSNRTLAHEMQHLMNYVTGRAMGRSSMDTWINEGLSGAAEYMGTHTHNEGRIEWYNNDRLGTIVKGNNFFVWETGSSVNPNRVLDDYATVYMFFNWLRLQASTGSGIYKTIINSTSVNYTAVTAAAAMEINSGYSNNWPLLLRDWMAANYINAPSGRYGYRNDPLFKQILPKFLSGIAGSLHPLAPGEGIYTQKTSMPGAVSPIKYAGLPSKGSLTAPNDSSAAGSSALLSYNTNLSMVPISSNCDPFSVETDPSLYDTRMDMAFSGLFGQLYPLSEPYPISMGDMLRQNGFEGDHQ